MTDSQHKLEFYRMGNIETARIIASDPVKCPGVMQEWARLVLNPPAEQTAPATGRAA